jgi:WD40 repeat protein
VSKPAPESALVLADAKLLKAHEKFVFGVAISPDGKWIASAGEDMAMLWDAATGEVRFRLEPPDKSSGAEKVAFSPDGNTLAVGGYVGNIRLWDTKSGTLKGTFEEPSLAVLSLAYSPDGTIIAAIHDQEHILLLDAQSGKLLAKLSEDKDKLQAFSFSSDGKTLASIAKRKIILWNVSDHSKKKTFEVDSQDQLAGFDAIACSPVAPLFAATGGDLFKKRTRIWDLTNYQEKGVLDLAPFDSVKSLAFSPNGKWLASGADGIGKSPVSLWSVATGKKLATLEGPSEGVTQIAFSKDGKLLAASSMDKGVRLWDLTKVKQ